VTQFRPASLAYNGDGTPYSAAYDDIYHSAAGGLGQARHVFLAGNGLLGEDARWRKRDCFVIVETGFGIGLNFLATWQAWRDDPRRCERLHFVSFENHPFTGADLAVLHARWPELADCSAALRHQWPSLLPGAQRLFFDEERVVLTLFLGDARTLLPKLRANVDAFYLDGFSPDKNPQLWSARICSSLARLAVTGATLATWTVAGAVRESLSAVGFSMDKTPGYAGKREMSRGIFRVRRRPRGIMREHSAVVVGAGLAGCSIAERLGTRGWQVQLIESAASAAQGASGNHAGVLRPQPSVDDNPLARLSRAAFLHARRHLAALSAAGLPLRWSDCGVLYVARNPVHEAMQRQVATEQTTTEEYLRFVERPDAATLARWPVAAGGWWFPGGGWVRPPSLCHADLQRRPGHIQLLTTRTVAEIQRRGDAWYAIADTDEVIASAPVLILANAGDGNRLAGGRGNVQLPTRTARGQLSYLTATTDAIPGMVICRNGYVTPPVDGINCLGASFSIDDDDGQIRGAEHQENLARLDAMLPGYAAGITPEVLAGRVGFRSVTRDRMPIIGAIADADAASGATRLADIPRRDGLYGLLGLGSRGLVWAPLAAELLAAQITGEPLPLEGDLVDAVDPGRFLLRQLRRV